MPDGARRVVVSAPATSANLGPGFDAFGLALELRDRVEAEVVASGLAIEVLGEGADTVPRDEAHLLVQAMRRTFEALGETLPGLRLTCHNVIPHGRGLGSSSAAIVAGILLAEALARTELSFADAYALATEIEGHPDNVAACLAGGFTVAWEAGERPCLARHDVDARIEPVVFIPPGAVSTEVARGLLPAQVSHRDASVNAGRAALMALALTSDPSLLLAASEDRLHQEYRRPAMPESLALVDALRADGIAAMVSGAGPTVIALDTGGAEHDLSGSGPPGWRVLRLAVSASGAGVVG